jgi:hypothetical protein
MSLRFTKSRNLDVYPYFLGYDDPRDIPYERIAEIVGKTPNSIRAMIRSARHNSTIYLALRKKGYEDHQFPEWFARPDKPLEYRRADTAGTRTSAEERSGSGERSEGKGAYTRGIRGVAQEGSAERPSALSMSSAPPAHTYWIVQPAYQRAVNPYLDKMSWLLIDAQEEEMKESLDRMKSRREPLRPMTPHEFKVQLEVAGIRHDIERMNIAQALHIWNMMQSERDSKPFDVKIFWERLSKSIEARSKTVAYDANVSMEKAFEVIGRLSEGSITKTQPADDLLRECESAAKEKRESDWEVMKELAKIMAENRRRRNMPLELLEREQRKMFADFYENLGRIWRGF